MALTTDSETWSETLFDLENAEPKQYPAPPVLDEGVPDLPHQLLKVSGEFLAGEKPGELISAAKCDQVAAEVAEVLQDYRVGIVPGGGNIWRGDRDRHPNMTEEESHFNGMLATYQNARSLGASFRALGIPFRVMSHLDIPAIVEIFNPEKAMHHLRQGRVVIFACGTGRPHCTTDYAGAYYATVIQAQRLLKASHGDVNGVFTADPRKSLSARHLPEVDYMECLVEGYEVMDQEAFAMCRGRGLPISVFSAVTNGSITRALLGETVGSLVHNVSTNWAPSSNKPLATSAIQRNVASGFPF